MCHFRPGWADEGDLVKRQEVGRLMRVQSYWQPVFSVSSFCTAAKGLHSDSLWYNTFRLIWRLVENSEQNRGQRLQTSVLSVSVFASVFTAVTWLGEDWGWRTPRLNSDSCAASAGSDVTGHCWECGGGSVRLLTLQPGWYAQTAEKLNSV